jgi:Fe-S-cluster containining protein
VSAVSELCPHCGLCCNGVLFGDVEVQRADKPRLLAAQGVELFAKSRKQAFNQPCACFDGALCNIYHDRPRRCRTFDCRQVQLVQAGKTTVAAARKSIREAKQRSDEVLRLVRALGDTNETLPLNRRYAVIMAQPMDLAGDEVHLELRGELMMAVARLVETLERDFLKAESEIRHRAVVLPKRPTQQEDASSA